MPQKRKRRSSNLEIDNSGEDMMLNAKNLEILMPEEYDASVVIESESLDNSNNLFINPAHILQMFHDQNIRIKLLEEKLEKQQKIIESKSSGKEPMQNESDDLKDHSKITGQFMAMLKRVKKCESTVSEFETRLRNCESTK